MPTCNLLEKLGYPKYVLAPMVNASELAWRMLGRRYGVQLTYSPMINSKEFLSSTKYRQRCLQFSVDDRPLIVQFCANDPKTFVEAAKYVEDQCDAVDLNLGCPQGIAKRGHYGAFLQDEWDLLTEIVSYASRHISVPITCKIRVFECVERTIQYAQMLERAGVSMLSVHGRTREMKGQNTGLADWDIIKAVKEAVNIPVIANGNIQYLDDVLQCLAETKCDAVMSAVGHLHNPAIFAGIQPSVYDICLEYFELVLHYPTTMDIIRGHVFKLCYYALGQHSEFRSQITNARIVVELRDVIQNLKDHCSACKENEQTFLLHPHWLCKPHERQALPTPETTISTSYPQSSENDTDSQVALMKKIEIAEERRIRKALRKESKYTKRLGNKKKLGLCQICNTNRKSHDCIQLFCKVCCQKTENVNQCQGK